MILKKLTHSDLLNKIDQKAVWNHILGYNFDKYVRNPFRIDNNPNSCIIEDYKGILLLNDWADRSYKGISCIRAYKMLNPNKTDLEIQADLLNISGYKKEKINVEIKPKSKIIEIIPYYTDFTLRDYMFWMNRFVTESQLNDPRHKVSAINGYKIIKEDKTIEVTDLKFSYIYHINNEFKLYFPYADKKYRFLGTVKENNNWYLERASDTLMVVKANKDFLVWENLVDFDLVALNGEGIFSELFLRYIWNTYKRKLIWLDNDKAGLENMKKFSNIFPDVECMCNPIEWGKDIDEFMVKTPYFCMEEVNKLFY